MKNTITTGKHFIMVAIPSCILLLIGDRITKMVAPQYFADPYVIVPHILELSFLGNKNFLFYWEFPMWLVLGVISMVIVFLGWQCIDALKRKQYLVALFLSIIFVGAASNIYDRLFLGYVVDFIRVPFWSVFNLADVYVVGGVLALLSLLWQTQRKIEEEKNNDPS